MPTLAVVDGVKVQMYAQEHPPPHFHAVSAEHRALLEIGSLRILKGTLPRPILSKVVAWARPRRALLQQAWNDLQAKRLPEKIQ